MSKDSGVSRGKVCEADDFANGRELNEAFVRSESELNEAFVRSEELASYFLQIPVRSAPKYFFCLINASRLCP